MAKESNEHSGAQGSAGNQVERKTADPGWLHWLGRCMAYAAMLEMRPKPVATCMWGRVKDVTQAILMVPCSVLLLAITVILLCAEPLMILARPIWHSIFNAKVVDAFIAVNMRGKSKSK